MKTNLEMLNKETTRTLNGGGKVYRCNICGYQNSSYAKVYANALACVTKKYGWKVYRMVTNFLG